MIIMSTFVFFHFLGGWARKGVLCKLGKSVPCFFGKQSQARSLYDVSADTSFPHPNLVLLEVHIPLEFSLSLLELGVKVGLESGEVSALSPSLLVPRPLFLISNESISGKARSISRLGMYAFCGRWRGSKGRLWAAPTLCSAGTAMTMVSDSLKRRYTCDELHHDP
jgi:hypothetical protein